MKVMTIVGTRPEIIKLSRVIAELDKYVEHTLVHTGQNFDYELNEIFFKELEIRKPDIFLEAVGENAAKSIGKVISKADDAFDKINPDAVLILGDTNSCLSIIASKRRKIPIFHMEAGNRCFDQRVPEEINRKIVDHISDINMPYTEHARRYLLAEGLKPETIIKTGSPMREVLEYFKPKIEQSDVLAKLNLDVNGYFLVSAHREENIDSEVNFKNLIKTLRNIATKYDKPVIVSTHPRTQKKIEACNVVGLDRRICFLKPFGFFDYVKLQMNACCVLSDSGTVTEESSILNIPAVMIRNAHERPEGMDEGTLIMCGLEANKVMESIEVVRSQYSPEKRFFNLVEDYAAGNVSKKVVRIIMSYTAYINRTVWFKQG